MLVLNYVTRRGYTYEKRQFRSIALFPFRFAKLQHSTRLMQIFLQKFLVINYIANYFKVKIDSFGVIVNFPCTK